MKYILGIDVGGTKIAAGLVDEVFTVSEIKTEFTSQTELLGQLMNLIESYAGFAGIGLGVPGIVSSNGMVEGFNNIQNFKPTNLKEMLENKFKVPVNVMNDAEAFTLAQAKVGFKEPGKTFGVILGTGIGGGFVEGENHHDAGMPFIHLKLPELEAEMQRLGSFDQASQTEPFIVKLLPVIIENFNPDLIVFGGSRSHLPGVQQILDNAIARLPQAKVSVKVSQLDYAGVIGAAWPLLKK